MAKGAKVAAEWAAKNKEYLFKLLEIGTTVGPPLYNLAKNIPFADIINPDIIGAILAAASGEPALAGYLLDQGIREIKYELTQCFTAGTLVETDQGPVPIEEIEEGDYVLSLNFETGELEYNTVTSVYIGETDELYLITAGGDVIEATYGHPFYVEEEGWVEAGELQAGDTLVMSGSSTVQVASVEVVYLEEPVLVYNIEVKGTHNYFVGGGVLVHNGCGSKYTGELIKVSKEDAGADALAVRIGGESRVRFANDPNGREFDVVSDKYIGQTKPAIRGYGEGWRNQTKATFEAAIETGRTPYFHFEGAPSDDVLRKLEEYGKRYGVEYILDTVPLGY